MTGFDARDADQAADPASYARSILNILEDFGEEKARLQDTQKAVLNILEDSGADKLNQEATQKATLNILEDAAVERARLEATQKAVLNILDDFDAEKNKVERTNLEMAREIAERKLAEEALRQAKAASDAANREIEAFSYSVSHDLRQPLRGITGFCQMLVEDCREQLDAQAREYLDTIVGQAEKMGRLIDELLMLSRISRQELERVPVDLTALCNEVVDELRKLEPRRQIEVKVAGHLETQGDPRLLRIALRNLIGNGWKFTSKRPDARIEIGSRQEGDLTAFFVADNGVGFSMKYADKLFGAFQRLHRATEFEGTGIGLATVQRIIHRHGGRVWAEAEAGKGATFLFSL